MTGTFEHHDPTTLLIGDNVRDSATVDALFVASVREHGVLQPVTAVRTDDGVEVRDGQRRTLAAREAGLTTIPVYVLDVSVSKSKAATADRIAQQIVANDHRAALTDAQRVKGINQMLLAGVSPTRVAKKLSVDRDTVTAAATAAESSMAMAALDAGQLSLTEAAALREFEGDTDAVNELLSVAGTAGFEHRVAQIRQDRLAEQARAVAETVYAEKGFAVLADCPGWRDTSTVLLRHLRTADDQQASEDAITDPSQWAVLLLEDTALVDATTGEPVDEADVDWNTEHRPDREPAEGMRDATTVVETVIWLPEYYCRDPQACGLTLADFLTSAKPVIHDGEPESAEARADTDRAQRRKVLALNKLGAAAQEVRQAWVRDHLLARKTPVKGAAVFVTTCLERGPGLLVEHTGRQLVSDLLGRGEASIRDTVARLGATADARAQVLLLGMVLAALEGRTPKDAWRQTRSTYRPVPGAADYLRFLAANGYPLSAIEQVVTGGRDADAVFDEKVHAA
jgi:ParB family chromosome partitioning protein